MGRKDDRSHVLVVEDEADVRELLVDALSTEDILVSAVASGAEALALAAKHTPDILITDLNLGDCWGTDVIDQLRGLAGHLPVVVITGRNDAASLVKASQHGPVELMSKPLDIDRLRETLRRELDLAAKSKRTKLRTKKLRYLARDANIERKLIQDQLDSACADLTDAYRTLSGQMALQQIVIGYQSELIGARNDDDVFRELFQLFVKRSGPVFGMALVCDAEAELRIAGRFGVPFPDKIGFCSRLSAPLVEQALQDPRCSVIDAWDQRHTFDDRVHKFLPGLTLMTIPLLPTPGELIGLVVLYRKGEQPFTEIDTALAEMLGNATAVAVQRND